MASRQLLRKANIPVELHKLTAGQMVGVLIWDAIDRDAAWEIIMDAHIGVYNEFGECTIPEERIKAIEEWLRNVEGMAHELISDALYDVQIRSLT